MRRLTEKEMDAWDDYSYNMMRKARQYEMNGDYAKMLHTLYTLYSHPYNQDKNPIVDRVFKNPRMFRWMTDYRRYLHDQNRGNEASWVYDWEYGGDNATLQIARFVGRPKSELVPYLKEEIENGDKEQGRLLQRFLEIHGVGTGRPVRKTPATKSTKSTKTTKKRK